MLPPGRDRLSTKPSPTGSGTWANTTGMVRVSRCNATAADVGAPKITFGFSATSSAA